MLKHRLQHYLSLLLDNIHLRSKQNSVAKKCMQSAVQWELMLCLGLLATWNPWQAPGTMELFKGILDINPVQI